MLQEQIDTLLVQIRRPLSLESTYPTKPQGEYRTFDGALVKQQLVFNL